MHALCNLCGEFLLPVPCCLKWGVFHTHPMLYYTRSFSSVHMLLQMGNLSYTPRAVLCGSFSYMSYAVLCKERFLHAPCFYVGSFSYMPRALLCVIFFLHAPCCFMCGVSLTRPVLFYVGIFSYTPRAIIIMWGVSLTRPVL